MYFVTFPPLKVHTFSTRSMKKSLTSFVFVNFAAMLTRPLERFYRKEKRVTFKNYYFFLMIDYIQILRGFTLKLASISLKALVFPLRAVQTRLNREEKEKPSIRER